MTLSGGVFIVFYESGKSKVGNLTDQVISNQDVGCSQVSVDVVHPLDICHATCDLLKRQSSCDTTVKSLKIKPPVK